MTYKDNKVLALVVIGIARRILEPNSNLNEHSNEFTTKSSVTIKYGQVNSNASH